MEHYLAIKGNEILIHSTMWVNLVSWCQVKKTDTIGHILHDQPLIFTGRTDAEAEAPVFWPPDAKSRLTGKDLNAGKDWRQEKKGIAEDEMVGWHHWLSGHVFEQVLRDGDGQGSLGCCSTWGPKELDMTGWLNNKTKRLAKMEESLTWFQTILQSYSLQDSMVLAPKQKYRPMEQVRKPRDKPIHIWAPYLWQRKQEYTMEKR